DSDCQVDAAYFARIENHIQSLNFDICGGPVLLPPHAPLPQAAFQSALANPFVVGITAARYSRRGQLRKSDEKELILCNLAARAEFFRNAGSFNEALYPNEENEWLDRVRGTARIYYDPDLIVRRAQRIDWYAFILMLVR